MAIINTSSFAKLNIGFIGWNKIYKFISINSLIKKLYIFLKRDTLNKSSNQKQTLGENTSTNLIFTFINYPKSYILFHYSKYSIFLILPLNFYFFQTLGPFSLPFSVIYTNCYHIISLYLCKLIWHLKLTFLSFSVLDQTYLLDELRAQQCIRSGILKWQWTILNRRHIWCHIWELAGLTLQGKQQ